jgi:hypothetical protein
MIKNPLLVAVLAKPVQGITKKSYVATDAPTEFSPSRMLAGDHSPQSWLLKLEY